MSLLVAEQYHDRIIMCSDTRLAIERDGIIYAANDTAKKLYVLGNDMVISGSGAQWTIAELANRIEKQNLRDIDKIISVAKSVVKDYKRLGGVLDGSVMYLKLVVAMIDSEGKAVLYFTGDSGDSPGAGYDWQVQKKVVAIDDAEVFTSDSKSLELYMKWRGLLNFDDTVRVIFNECADCGIGGKLEIAELSKEGITKREYDISDAGKSIRWLDVNDEIKTTATATDFYFHNGNSVTKILDRNQQQIPGGLISGDGLHILNGGRNSFLVSNGKIIMGEGNNSITIENGGVTIGSGVKFSWSAIIDAPSIPTVPSYIRSTYIDGARIESPTIIGATLHGGQILSDTIIDVGTDLKVGNKIEIGEAAYSGKKEIRFNNGSVISSDGNEMTLSSEVLNLQGPHINFTGAQQINFSNIPIVNANVTARWA